MNNKKAILVIGAGNATGGAIARRFAREGYIACVTRRSADKLEPLVNQILTEGGQAHGFGSDARKEEEMVALVERIERDIAPIEVTDKTSNHTSQSTESFSRLNLTVFASIHNAVCAKSGTRNGNFFLKTSLTCVVGFAGQHLSLTHLSA
jgi:NAD(P)-dependent dehydrogenase (short-subunit alcohol dehydrogenase family)